MSESKKAVIVEDGEALEKMRAACRLAADVLNMITPQVKEGISTVELDAICHQYIIANDAKAAPPTVGFPKAVCTSVNHVVCHGIPSDKKLKGGDLLNIDVTVIKDGYYGDTSKMFIVGRPNVLTKRLVEVTQECLYRGILAVKPGGYLGDIGAAISEYAHQNRFSIVRDYCGHGIGTVFHGEPQVLHFGRAGTGIELKPGMTFTIEPMVNAGRKDTKLLSDGWTVVTRDKRPSAQWEHTMRVTETGVDVLTIRDEEVDLKARLAKAFTPQ